jgi:radical SAM protein with 4Fe4S-binding SPASM domain
LRSESLSDLSWRHAYLRLNRRVALNRLERLYLYHIDHDELYELSDSAEPFLLSCDGTAKGEELTSDAEFVVFCIKEALIDTLSEPDPVPVTVARSPDPSLRYLELQLLHRCNLKCRHCYLGPPRSNELALEDAVKITEEFAFHGGLRLLISGGEPLLYPWLKEFIDQTADMKIRRVLFTNGTRVTKENRNHLRVDEIQFSLDGWRDGHDLIRGRGSFDRTVQGIRLVQEIGIPVSIATMIHSGNVDEFDTLKNFVEEIGAVEWGIDVLSIAGRMIENQDLVVPVGNAVPLMAYGFGGGYHGSSGGFACGGHLLTVLPTGQAVKCGFYENSPLGDARDGLIECWSNLEHIPFEALECRECPAVHECSGGCRFRAEYPGGPDPVMCAIFGIKP